MSDFFMPTQKNDYWNKKQEEQKTQQAETAGQNGGYWDKKTESYNQAKAQHYENWNRYGVEVPDEYYNVFNQIISKAETPEQAQEEAYRIGSAVKYAKMYGMSLDEAYKNVDAFNEAQFTNLTGQKARYEALTDMFTLGTNNVKLGKLGNKLMVAQRDGDTELAEALKAEIGAIQEQNVLLQDNAPRSWVMQALEAGAQSLPFTGAVASAGIIGNFIAPAVGTGAAFLASSYLSSGQEYIDSLANGATPETARTISMISGGIQGLIEADLGITSGIVKGTARVMGKEVAESAAKKAVEEIGQKVFKRFHFGAGKKLVMNYLTQRGKNILGEGTEEFLQELTSIAGQEVMAALDGYDIPDDDAKSIVKQVGEAFRGGVLGAISLGFIPAGLNTAADIKEFKKVKEEAETVESPEVFHNLVKDNPIFEGMGEDNLKATTHEIWERAQQRKEEAINEKAKEILETTDLGEGAEEREVNEQGEEEPLNAVARNEEGRLDIQDDETTNEDGTISGNFRAGDRTKEKNNRYGYINYTADEKNKTVEINNFVMGKGREGLRGELFDEFSRKYAGYKVEWNTTTPAGQAIKESLIENNPNGSKAGLSYYSDEDLSDIQTRKRVAAELKQNIYSIEQVTDANGNVSYVKKELSNKQVAAGIALLESAAKRMGMSLSNYVDKTFSSRIFATEKEFEDAVAAQGDTTAGKAGAMEWKRFGQELKAVIYAGEYADFSTWVHELAHVFQSQLTGDLKAQAEKAFNVIDGDWINSKFTFADGHTDSAAEAFAYGFQDWLKTGKAESEELKNIFQKFAEFLARAFNALKKHIDFTPEIEAVYNQLLAGDDSILAKAEKAAEEEDRAYRAKMKADQEAKTAAAQQEAEDAKKAEAAEREEKSEVTEYAEENADEVTEAEKKLDEVTNEETENESNAIDNAIKDLNLTDEKKTELSEVLKNPDETQQAKAGAIVDAASESAYGEDEEESFESLGDMLFQTTDLTQDFADIKSGAVTEKDIENHNIFFQIAGEIGAANLDKNEEVAEGVSRMQNLAIAKEMEEANKDAKEIRLATGWEKGDDGKWRYEIDDSSVHFDLYSAMEEWDNEHPRYKELEKKFFESGLSDEEQEEFDKWVDERNYVQDKHTDLSFAEKLYGKDFRLPEVMNHPELFKAYPELKDVTVSIREQNSPAKGDANYEDKHINLYRAKEDTGSFEEWEKEAGSVLLHEVQHIIQGIEGFAKGADLDTFTPGIEAPELTKALSGFRTYSKEKLKNFSAAKEYQQYKDLGMSDAEIKELRPNIDGLGTIEEIIERDIKDHGVDWVYDEIQSAAEVVDNEGIIKVNGKKYVNNLDAYRSTAGEVESRNVQTRMKLSPAERVNILLKETEDVAPKDKIILFQTVYHGSGANFDANNPNILFQKEQEEIAGAGKVINKDNYFKHTFADWKLSKAPNREPDYKSDSGSEYWYTDKGVYRRADHWGTVATCTWLLEGKSYQRVLRERNNGVDKIVSNTEGQKVSDIGEKYGEEEHLSSRYDPDHSIWNYKLTGYSDFANIKKDYDMPFNDRVIKEIVDNVKTEERQALYDNRKLTNEERNEIINNTILDIKSGASVNLAETESDKQFVKDLSLDVYNSYDKTKPFISFEHGRWGTPPILFQTVYHGSGAQFDKFNTKDFALSGEGSMSFGYGTYLTDNEEIARDYAERQSFEKDSYKLKPEFKDRDSIVYDILALDKAVKKGEDFAQAKEQILRNLKNDLESKKASGYPERIITWAENDVKHFESLNSISDIDNIFENRGRHLYTVEIPDDGYLEWDRLYKKNEVSEIAKALRMEIEKDYPHGDGYIDWDILEELEKHAFTTKGANLLNNIKYIFVGNRTGSQASKYLNRIGYAGIKYPAGTIHGNGNGAYNYVIFNDDDAKIIDHLLFQTQEELYKDARDFDTWQDFMDFYESFGKPENSLVPFDADAQWYQSIWEMAHGLQTEQEQNEEKAKTKRTKESDIAGAMDALFMTAIRTQPEMLDRFLKLVSQIDAIDLDGEEWQHIDEEGAEARDWYERMKDFISFSLSDYNWQTAMRRVRSGNEISEGLRKRLVGEMTDPIKARDFRAIYAEVMEDEEYAVDPQDTVAARLSEKLNKYAKKYHDIVKPNEDIARVSPERRKQIAQEMANRDIAAKIANGSLKLDDELDRYIKVLAGQTKAAQKQLDELEKETKADYQRIADAERRKLLKVHEELLLARGKMTKRNSEIERRINAGLKITEKYQRETQNMKANYDEIFRKYKDLENSIQLTAEVKEAITRQEHFVELKEDLNNQKKEKSLAEEVKKMRIQLVKRTMRRVPFNRIDYENAKTVIAIQRMLEPNLMGGVNRFIGIDSPFLRGVISQILTDSDYKQKILNYLSKSQKSSKAFVNFKNKLENMKSIKEFDEWTRKEREYAIKHLPKENWVKELNLEQLAKEREESIDLDISVEERPQIVYDEKTGEPKQYKDADGQTHTVTVPVGRTVYSDEIGRRVMEAVGADMFDKIVNLSFAEWTTEDLEELAKRIDELYVEGRELLAAKNEARKREAERLRKQVEDVIKETGITINDDDTQEEKEKKLKKIAKITGMSSDLKGTEAGKERGLKARLNRLLHGYSDMNLLRFARMLDNQSEGVNTYLLYRKEDECFNAKQRSITSRADTVRKVMTDNNITEADLAEVVKVESLDTSFTVDELLYFLAADKDYEEDEKKLAKGEVGIDANDDFAATSRNAVMFGNMMSDNASQEQKEAWDKMDKDMAEALKNDTLSTEQKQLLAIGQLDKTPGTTAYIRSCHAKWEVALGAANSFLNENPKFKALMEAIEADYAAQYERMNEVSINEFNTPVHRVKAYVPLVRKESNGEDNVNQVKDDLLGAYGAESGKQWVNKGMTQRRVNIAPLHQKPVQTGLFNTWASSIERTEHFIAYAPYVRQLNAIYKSRDAAYTRRFIEARYGKAAIEYLDSYINEVANPKAGKIREKGAEFLHTLRGRTAPAYLGWKASGIIKQGLTSPWPYMQFVNPAEYAAACFECLNPEKKAYEAIKEKSVFMRTRSFDPIKDLVDEVSENAKSKLDRNWSKITAIGMKGLEWIDWACVAPGWLACYKKKYNLLQKASEARYQAKVAELTEKNMSAELATSEWLSPDQIKQKASQEVMDDIEMEAITYADDCTRQCQPSSRLTDLAPLFKNSSEAMKAFLQFQTSLNVIWQNIRYDIPYAVRQKQFGRIAGGIIGYVMAGIFMNSVMDGLMGDDDEDKDLQALRNLIFYSTTQFTDAIPMIGSEITNTMDMLITGKRNFSQSGTDMTPSATKLLNALTKATKGDFKKAAALTAEGIGLGIGAPVSGTKEIYKFLGSPLKEGDINPARGVGDVYGLAGDIIGE